MRALQSLRDMSKEAKAMLRPKWDGSAFGRNENGEFVLTDKSGFVRKGGEGRTTGIKKKKTQTRSIHA